MGHILLGLPKETVSAIMMPYKNTKAMVYSPDRDTDIFNIDTRVLQGDTHTPYLFIFCLNNLFQIFIDLIKK